MNRLATAIETLKLAAGKPAVILAAASLTSLATASKAEALPPAVGQTTTLLKQGETLGKGTGVLVDYQVGKGIYCDGKSPYTSEDYHVGSDMDDGANMGGNWYGHTAFLGLLSGQTSDAYYSIKTGWALHKEEDLSYGLYHFDTQNYKTERGFDSYNNPGTWVHADMVGQKVASLSLAQLAVVGSGRWTDGHTDFEITPDEDSPLAPYQSMNQFYFRMHVQCASEA